MKIVLIILLVIGMFVLLGGIGCEDNGDADPISPDPVTPEPVDPPEDPEEPVIDPDDPEWENILSYLVWFDDHSEELNVMLNDLSDKLNDYDLEEVNWINATINKMDQIELKIEEAREQEPHELFNEAYLEYLKAMDFYEEGISIVRESIEEEIIDLIFEADLRFDEGDEHFKEALRLHLESVK